MKLVQRVTGSPDSKVGNEIERLGLKPGAAISLNPLPIPPLDSESKYVNERGLKIEKCDDGYYRWFKPVNSRATNVIGN